MLILVRVSRLATLSATNPGVIPSLCCGWSNCGLLPALGATVPGDPKEGKQNYSSTFLTPIACATLSCCMGLRCGSLPAAEEPETGLRYTQA